MIIDFSHKILDLPKPENIWERDVIEFIHEYQNNEKIQVQTSGSTGEPKRYYLPKTAMQQSAQLTGQFLKLNQGDSALLCMPMQYIAGKMMVVRAMELQMKLYCIEPKVNLDIQHKIDFGAMTPMQAEVSMSKLDNFQKLILGGAKVSQKLENQLASLDNCLYETYGMTETITHIAMRQLNYESSFHTLPHIAISQDERNCLVINTPYFEQPIVTNDLVEIVDDHSFNLLGRVDNIINSGGIKVNPEKLETILQPYINQPFIIHGIEDEVLGEKIVLIIEGNRYDVTYPSDIIPKNQRPKSVHFVAKFPRTLSGKIKRKEISL